MMWRFNLTFLVLQEVYIADVTIVLDCRIWLLEVVCEHKGGEILGRSVAALALAWEVWEIDATQKETAIDQQHSCETLICQS